LVKINSNSNLIGSSILLHSMKKIQISPSILSADFSQLGNEIKRLEEGGADMIHVDVMDGHFVPNLTIGPPVIKALRNHCSLKFDVHLMISPVHQYIDAYADAGADIITIHPEATEDLEKSILRIKELKKKVGVSLNPETKIDLILDHLDKIDLVLIMSVNPGFGGQKFMPEVLSKIKELKKIQSEKNIDFDIEIDGGINFENYKLAIEAGANILVSGTTIFKSNNGDIKKNIDLLKTE
jgi:ribulose-phosphate 3-epimerase